MTTRLTGWLVVVCLSLVPAGCSAVARDAETTAAKPAVASSATVSRSAGFPEGTYTVTATRKEAQRRGFPEEQIARAYGSDGTLQISLKFGGGHWTQFAEYTPGIPEPGDVGTYRVDVDKLVMTSASEGCPGCVGVLDWTFDGGRLDLRYTKPAEHDIIERLMTEHEYTKVG